MTIFSGRGLTSIYTILLRMLKDECNKEKFKLDHIPLEDFTNCLWQRQPKILPIWLAYRLVLFVYFLTTFAIMVFSRPEEGYLWYKNALYVAYWSYFVEVLALGLAFAATLEQFVKEKKMPPRDALVPGMDPEMPPREKTPWHYKALWFLYTMAASSTLTVTTMYWFFLYEPGKNFNVGYSVVTRIFNSVFFIMDVFLNAIPFRFLHFYIPCTLVLCYVIFTVIYQCSGGTGNKGEIPIYTILDWRNPRGAISTVFIFLACSLLFHCGMCVINIFKNWLKKPSESQE